MAKYYVCSKCGRSFKISISLDDLDKQINVMSCRVCGLSIWSDVVNGNK
ncbi:hypothetical protein KAW18_13160 [candidate division WOR-3 bacterium]|nr:hypothetical protein [candidate division WOR-3 bacterium]